GSQGAGKDQRMSTIAVPAFVIDLPSFRRWARSEEFPERGSFSYLAGKVWMDLSKEEIFSHNLVRAEFTATLGSLAKQARLGYWFGRRVLLSNPAADLSTQPDGMVVSYAALREETVRFVKDTEEDYVEVEGTPDMVLEVINSTSARRDTEMLR